MVRYDNVDDLLKFANDLINKNIINFKQFNYLYPFTTENISGYIDKFDLLDKSLLTVGSSCDQALNAITHGCRDITIYDICPFTKVYYYLKVAAIKSLNIEEYLQFFSYVNYPILFLRNMKAFDESMFDKIFEYLKEIDEEASYFWLELFNKYKGRIIRKKLFNPDECNLKTNKKMNCYLKNNDIYNILKNNIDKVNVDIIHGDIFNINLDRQFDNIFLSNILSYSYFNKYIELFYKLKNYLSSDGKMLVSYLYDTDSCDLYVDDAYNRYSKEDIIKAIDTDVDFITFKGNVGISLGDYTMTDSIITYKKVKKI